MSGEMGTYIRGNIDVLWYPSYGETPTNYLLRELPQVFHNFWGEKYN